MSLHQYNKKARARISRAVRWTETQTRDLETRRRRGSPAVFDQLVRLQADIEHGKIGDAKRLGGPAIEQSLSVLSTEPSFKVYNPGAKVWSGADCLIAPFGLPDADITNQTTWYIVQAWSATRIRGVVQTSTISPGQTGTIGTITTIDGTYSPTTASVFLPTAFVAAGAGKVAWAELVFRASTGTSRWEIYSVDCEAS